MDADGGNLKQLSTTEDHAPAISPDGRWVVFHSWVTGKQTLWKISIDGGQAVQVSDRVLSDPVFSPDGKLLSCMLYDESMSPPRWRTALVSFEDGQLVKVIDLPLTVWKPLWSIDGRALIYSDKLDFIGNIWSQPIEGGAPKQLTRFTSKFIDSFDISRDGKRFLLTRSTGANDIVLIKDFK